MWNQDGITTPGLNATSPSQATTWFSGNIDLEIFYSEAATAGDLAALNAYDGTASGGELALNLATSSYGFSLVSATTLSTVNPTAGAISYAVDNGDFVSNNITDPDQINLLAPVPSNTTGDILLYAVAAGGEFDGDSGALAFSQALGHNPYAVPPGPPAIMTVDPTGENLVLEAPEPAMMVVAGLGGLSLLFVRRRG